MTLGTQSIVATVGDAGQVVMASSSLKPWHLLHVDADVVDAMKMKLAVHDRLPVDSRLSHVTTFEAAYAYLAEHKVDAILVGYSFEQSPDDTELRELIQNSSGIPVVILSLDSHTEAIMRAGRLGARDFIPKSKVTGEALTDLLRPIVVGGNGEAACDLGERRKASRHDSVASAVVITVDGDGTPRYEIPASVVNISRLGIGLLVEHDPQDISDLCVVGVEDRDGNYSYATVLWRNRRLALPAIRMGGQFVTGEEDPLDVRQLSPRFDAKHLRYAAPLNAQLLQAWSARGVLRSRVVDRVKCCSECYSLLSYRDGCPECGSFDTEPTPLIHHFACAHVAPAGDFGSGEISCPKCRSSKLVVGADFEYLAGPRKCRECSWSDSELALIAECMGCGKRCTANETVEKEVLAYHVNRLDPLDFIQDTQ